MSTDAHIGALRDLVKFSENIKPIVDMAMKQNRELAALRAVCAEAYQLVGFYGGPAKALDNLSAAANGKPIPHKTFLPITEERK